MRRLTAVLALAGACGGTVSVGVNDSGVDAATTAPPPYDATFGTDASGGVSNPAGSSGGNQSSSSSGSSGGSLVLPSSSSSSGGGAPCTTCTSDSDCTSTCGPPPQTGYSWCCVKSQGQCASQSYSCTSGGSSGGPAAYCPSSCRTDSDCAGCPQLLGNAKNCCVMGICAMQTVCPLEGDSGGGAQLDATPGVASDGAAFCLPFDASPWNCTNVPCPSGSICSIEIGSPGPPPPDQSWCIPIPSLCATNPTCSCMSACACIHAAGAFPESCSTERDGSIIACDNGSR